MQMPMPRIYPFGGVDNNVFWGEVDTLEFYSAIFMWPPFRAMALFWLSNTWTFSLIAVWALYHMKVM